MTVNSPVRASTFTTQLDSSLHRVGCALAGGDSRSIAKAVLSEPSVREQVLRRVSQEVVACQSGSRARMAQAVLSK